MKKENMLNKVINIEIIDIKPKNNNIVSTKSVENQIRQKKRRIKK